MSVLDGYLLELWKKDKPLAKVLQFVLFQLQKIEVEASQLPGFVEGGKQDASLFLRQGDNAEVYPVSDRTEFTHQSVNDTTEFLLGAKFFNRLNVTKSTTIRGILPGLHGQKAILVNTGPTNSVLITHQDILAPVENQLLLSPPLDVTLDPDEAMYIWRDNIVGFWRGYKLGNTTRLVDTVVIDTDLTPNDVPLYAGSVTDLVVTGLLHEAYPVILIQAPGPYTGKGTFADEAGMDAVTATGVLRPTMGGSVVLDIYWVANPGPVLGNVSFYAFQGIL